MCLCDELIQVSFGVVCSVTDLCTFIPTKLSRFEARGRCFYFVLFLLKKRRPKVQTIKSPIFFSFLCLFWGGGVDVEGPSGEH